MLNDNPFLTNVVKMLGEVYQWDSTFHNHGGETFKLTQYELKGE